MASRRQQLTASSKLPTTAKPEAVSRAGTWSSTWKRRSDSALSRSLTAMPRVTAAIGPVAAHELGEPIQHRAGRAEAEGRQQDEPEEDAEHVAVRGEQRMLDHVAQEFGRRQLARVEVAPLGEQATRLELVAAVEGGADVGEVVAELAKAEREVEHGDVEGERRAAR